ncbi:MAG: hypothetical protein L0G99_09835 [Propionibacteriales bacterium]|nr:hypothetical protein [Propionibacteriales bacterium]
MVNERPIFLLQGNTPLFRDLKKGDSGRDVAALQSGLIALHYVLADGEIRSSTFGWTTARAVYDFYSDRSFAPVDAGGNPRTGAQVSSTGVPKTEFLMTPQVPLTPLAACGTVGQMADGPLCILTGTPFALTLQVPLAEAERIKQDMPVRRAGALVGTVKDRITEPSPTADAGKDSGGDEGGQSQQGESNSSTTPFSVTPAKGVMVDTTLAGSLEVVVAEVTDIAIVDAVAIRGTPQAPWVELVDGRRLDVTVGLCVSGRCEVNDIEPGTEVSVPRSTSETPG